MSLSQTADQTDALPTTESQDTSSSSAVEAAQTLLVDIETLTVSKLPLDEHAVKHLRKRSKEISQYLEKHREIQQHIERGLTSLRKRLQRQNEQRDRELAEIDNLLEQMDGALKEGQLKCAADAHNTVRRKLDKIADLSDRRRQPVLQRLEAAEPRLRELNSWRHWGTTLAREQLIEQVRNLHETEKSPVKIARAIQQARKTWQNWDRAGDSAGKELWKQFDTACSDAYKPCKQYFDERSAERARNLEHREHMCAQLEKKFHEQDWRNPDWRAIDKTIRKAERDWRTAGPVDRKAKKQIEQRFEQVINQFEEYLERERTRDKKRRLKLIGDVQALVENENIGDAIEAVKTAQRNWSPTVLDTRKAENQLWKDFKRACDAVFERREQQKHTESAQRQENLLAKQQICLELEQWVKQSGEEKISAESVIAQAQDRWQQAGDVPRKDETSVNKRFKRACAGVKRRAHTLANQAKERSLATLEQQAQVCVELETLALAGEGPEERVDHLKSQWQTLLANGCDERISKRYELALNAISDGEALSNLKRDLDKNHSSAQAICLQLEVLCDIESPAEFTKQRMQYQIQRLSAAMSKQVNQETEKNPTNLLQEYWLTGAIVAENRRSLDRRIARINTAMKPAVHDHKEKIDEQ